MFSFTLQGSFDEIGIRLFRYTCTDLLSIVTFLSVRF